MRFIFVGWLGEIPEIDQGGSGVEQSHDTSCKVVARFPDELMYKVGTIRERPAFVFFTGFPFCDAPPLRYFLGVQDFKLLFLRLYLLVDPLVDRFILFRAERCFAQFKMPRGAIGKLRSFFSGELWKCGHEASLTAFSCPGKE